MRLHVENLSKTFQSPIETINVLQDIEFELDKGEWLTIIGPSGSGKSTLLHCIAGITKPDSGSLITFDNRSMVKASEREKREFRREHIGFVYQDFRLFNQFDVLTNVMLPLKPYREKKQLRIESIDLIKKVGLTERIHAMPSQLSGGEKQRVAIARALVNQPDVIFCDEPTGNLDKQNRDKIMALLETANQRGTSIILVTHDLELMELGDKRLTLGYQDNVGSAG